MTLPIVPFAYSHQPHARRHGPCGYTDYSRYKPWLRDEFTFRCVYCLFRERWNPQGPASFSIDHAVPKSPFPERECDYENLLYACSLCNSFKQDRLLPDPCGTAFSAHLCVSADGSITAISDEGRRLVQILHLNRPEMVEWRFRLLSVLTRLSSFENGAAQELQSWFGFPTELPDLSRRNPPEGNSRPEGVAQSYFERRRRGEIPDYY